MTKSILSQLSIIMTSSLDIVSPPRIRGGIRQVSGGTTAGPRRIRGGIRVSRGKIESGQVRGSAGGLEKLSAGVSGLSLVKKLLDCTVSMQECIFNLAHDISESLNAHAYGIIRLCTKISMKSHTHNALVICNHGPHTPGE